MAKFESSPIFNMIEYLVHNGLGVTVNHQQQKNRSRYQTPHQIRRFTELVTLKHETIAEQFDDLITPNPAATFRILLTDSPLLLVIKALHGNLV